MAANWKPVKGEKGLYVRDYGDVKVYQVRAMCKGIRYTDTLGAMNLEEARIIRDQLAFNRKNGSGPLTWAEMQEKAASLEAARDIEEAKRAREILEAEKKRSLNTVGACWERSFWPHRLSLRRSAMETGKMAGRWRNYVGPFFSAIPIDELTPAHFSEFVARMRKKGVLGDTC